ncbi:MAG: hypothetical protein CMJ83_12460 [Planctomycetes bacterium]|nr:hypothetical protein [Planctomycetota bacterium]
MTVGQFITTIDEAALTIVPALLTGLLFGFVLYLLVATVLAFTPRSNAATRHVVWCAVLVAVVVLPFLPPSDEAASNGALARVTRPSPGGASSSPPAATEAAGTPFPARASSVVIGALGASAPATGESARGPQGGPAAIADARDEARRRFWSLPHLPAWLPLPLFLLWIVGAAVMLYRIFRGCRGLMALRRDSDPLPPSHQDRFDRLRRLVGCDRPCDVRSSPFIASPLTVGLFRPIVLLPVKLIGYLKTQELDQILAHELGHVRRRDDWSTFLIRVVQAVSFFNPVPRWIGRRLDLDREIACDDGVVAITRRPRRYADCLTRLAEITAGPRIAMHDRAALAPAALGPTNQLTRRIHMLLDTQRNTSPRPSLLVCIVVLGVAAMVGFPLVQALPRIEIAPVPQEPEARSGDAAPQRLAPSCCVEVPEPPDVPSEDHAWTKSGRAYSVSYRGPVVVAPDDGSIREVPVGGHARIRVKHGRKVLEYEVTRTPDDASLVRFAGNGKALDLQDEDTQELLEDLMEKAIEHTGLGARSRVRRLLDREGMPGVISELKELKGNYPRRRYVEEALRVTQETSQLAALARAASHQIGEGHLVAVMSMIAKRQLDDGQLTYDLIRVLRHVRSTSLRTRVLTAIASIRPLTGMAAHDFLQFATQRSCNGCGRPELLVKSLVFYLSDKQLRGEYFTALRNCNSEDVRRRAAAAILAWEHCDEELMEQCVRMTRHFGSDGIRSHILTTVASRTKSARLVDRILDDGSRVIGSDTARHNVMTAVLARKKLTSSNLDRVLAWITKVSSGHVKTSLLLAALPHCPGRTVNGVIELTPYLQSDPDRRQVLAAVLDRKDLDCFTLLRVFESMRQLSSDQRKSSLLVQVAPRCKPSLIDPFLEITWTLSSDAEKMRALVALLDNKELPKTAVAMIKKSLTRRFGSASIRDCVMKVVDAKLTD